MPFCGDIFSLPLPELLPLLLLPPLSTLLLLLMRLVLLLLMMLLWWTLALVGTALALLKIEVICDFRVLNLSALIATLQAGSERPSVK